MAGLHCYVEGERAARKLASKVVIIVSKKVAASAVMRNRLKRRAGAIIREIGPKLKLANYRLHFQKGDAELEYKDLRKKVYDFFHLS